MMEVLLYPDERLKMKSTPVECITEETKRLCEEMYKTMKCGNGIGLAAPQVGVLQRIVVIQLDDKTEPIFMVNPKITGRSKENTVFNEGCLSLPHAYSDVVRSETVRFIYTDLDGNVVEQVADGLLAVCVQHELDHLDGKLFIDRLSKKNRSMATRAFFSKQEVTCRNTQ